MKRYVLLVISIAAINFSFAQSADKRTWNWYFGDNAALKFTAQNLPPVPITTSVLSTNEGSSAISDSAGNLLFYTQGIYVWSNNDVVMPNGTGLKGSTISAQSALIVPMPGSDSLFYLFTVNNWSDPSPGLYYSVIDKSLNGGLGDVTAQKNILMQSGCREQLTASYHANGQDIWILSHEYGNNNFIAFLLTAQGVNMTPVISPAGAVNDGGNRYGYLKVSPSCNKIGSSLGGLGYVAGDTTIEVCDFNNTTGVVSNAVFLADSSTTYLNYGCEFSPDNTKFYVTEYSGVNIYQFDLTAANPASTMTNIAVSNSVIKASLTLGPDGKIYVARRYTNQLGVIEFPNLAGAACNYVDTAVTLTSGTNSLGSCNMFHTCSSATPVFSVDNAQNQFSVFPNPVSSELTVKCSEKINSLKITDVTGRIIFEKLLNTKYETLNTKINVSNFSKGIYFLKADLNGNIFLKKVVVQ